MEHRGTVIECDPVIKEFIKAQEKKSNYKIIVKELSQNRLMVETDQVMTIKRLWSEHTKKFTYEADEEEEIS